MREKDTSITSDPATGPASTAAAGAGGGARGKAELSGWDNPFGTTVTWWQKNGLPPWATALAFGGLTYGATRPFWGPFVETVRSLFRKPGKKFLGGDPDNPKSDAIADEQWNLAMDNAKNNSELRWKVPLGLGGLGTVLALYLFARRNEPYFGLTRWNYPKDPEIPAAGNNATTTPMIKPASVLDNGRYMKKVASLVGGMDMDIDYSKRVNLTDATNLFSNDKNLEDYPYTRNMGTAIVTNAAISGHTDRPTLGGILDSAVEKISNKLSFGGLASVGLRSMVANGAARLFTGALGQMVDLSPKARQTLVDAGTWAGAITAILE